MKSSPIQNSFNSGEISPLLAGRVDLKQYGNACKSMRNMIPTVQGPARRRPGTRFVGFTQDQAVRSWLGKFVFNNDQVYVIEFSYFGGGYIQFYGNHGLLPGMIASTPYLAADLTDADGTFALRFAQSGNVLYMTHPKYPPQKITRTGALSITCGPVAFTGGPFMSTPMGAGITALDISAVSGSGVTLNSDQNLFTAGMVGRLVYVEPRDTDGVKMWEPGKAVVIGDRRRSDGKNYVALTAGNTGGVKPLHTFGAKYDGDAGVQWQLEDWNYGIFHIDAYVNSFAVTGTVLQKFPNSLLTTSGQKSKRWAFSAWNEVDGYPSCVTFFRERLTFSRGRDVWGSVAGDFENFITKDSSGLVTLDLSYHVDTTTETSDAIVWLAPLSKALCIGTRGDELAMFEASSSESFGPGNIVVRPQTKRGSRGSPAVIVGESVFFAQRSGRKIRDMHVVPSGIDERWETSDATVMSEHICKSGVIDMTWQQEPDTVLWLVTADGRLVGFTINKEQQVQGFHNHRLGGLSDLFAGTYAVVESIVSIPAPAGDRNELWMIVRRVINGATVRYIEWIEYNHEKGDNPEDSFYVDAGLTLNNKMPATLTLGSSAALVIGSVNVSFTASFATWVAGDLGNFIHYDYVVLDVTGTKIWKKATAFITQVVSNVLVKATIIAAWPNMQTNPTNSWRKGVKAVSGLAHLQGETCQCLADGMEITNVPIKPDFVGIVNLPGFFSKIHIGLKAPAVLQTMNLEAGSRDGTAQGKTKRLSRVSLRLDETGGVKYGQSELLNMDSVAPPVTNADNDSAMIKLFTGDVLVSWPAGYNGEQNISAYVDDPLPATIVAIMPTEETQDDR